MGLIYLSRKSGHQHVDVRRHLPGEPFQVMLVICRQVNSKKAAPNVLVYSTVEPRYNEVLGTMKITLLYQVSHYIRVNKQRNIKSLDQQNYLVIRGFCYIRPLYNEVPLYIQNVTSMRGKVALIINMSITVRTICFVSTD